ncbi:Sodium-dependent nutrient amino acid transporter 1 [Trachymyrmex septentrionalis]|uniref:Sodium-dependent nutrient amino acid transporter 1 n=1 Tax=Trachymyrmex septentrionalis TaxID=34720 RepID=A0A151JZV9_9HYME|nr:Sodium-dependent nutrient amino acid transporter 1 [Trachymyrmex septentrionalis]
MPMRKNDSEEIEKSPSSIESLRNYVHNSGLCLNPDHYDAKERKIVHVAVPEFDTDVNDRRDTQEVHSDVEKVRRNVEKSVTRMSDEIQYLNRDVTVRMKTVVTNETLEKSFKTAGRDIIVRALQNRRYLERYGKSTKQRGGSLEKCIGYGVVISIFFGIIYYCALTALTLYYFHSALEDERIGRNKNKGKSMDDACADIQDMDGMNTDKLFEAMEVEFEDIMDQESNEKVQSNDTECLIGLNDGNTQRNLDCTIVISLDLCTSLMAGTTIFEILDNLAYKIGNNNIGSVLRAETGLVFVSYLEALAKFIVISQFFAILFFLMLFALGIGTIIAFCNVIISVIKDWKIAAGVAIFYFSISIVYCTSISHYILNLIIDMTPFMYNDKYYLISAYCINFYSYNH